jgi:EmrB/QacA subfamily drug resistance transporter
MPEEARVRDSTVKPHPTHRHAAISAKNRKLVIAASLLAVFLGALDALVMSAAMPTVVADLGRLDLYSWVYSAYLLTRAISLPIFGKLADIYRTKTLYIVSILIFIIASLAAGFSTNMYFLIVCRALKGIGAGGNFALAYIVLADISPPEERGKTLSLASFVWGLASVLGPTTGGFIVAYSSWPWIFFINVPLGVISLVGISFHYVEARVGKENATIDYAGALTLSIAILALLFIFLLAGKTYAWRSPRILMLGAVTLVFGFLFYKTELRAKDPILPISFFKLRGFSVGNSAVFMSSFAIFAFFGFAPLFIQGALGKSPVEVGTAMLALSMGWSVGSLIVGRSVHRWGSRNSAAVGAVFLLAGCIATLTFSTDTSMTLCLWVFSQIGMGMGFVALATILVVQNSVDPSGLGVATASHQFFRNVGGTVGVGICGSLFTTGFFMAFEPALAGGLGGLPEHMADQIRRNVDTVLRPEVQAHLTPDALLLFHQAVAHGSLLVFWTTTVAAVACLICCLLLPNDKA